MNILARSGGKKVTDTFQIFSIPTKNDDGIFEINFFVHGLRYMPQSSQECVTSLEANTQLLITKDCQNQYNSDALLLRTKNKHNLGYIPRYLTKDIIKLLDRDSQAVKVYVQKVNPAPAPIQLRLLCNLTAPWYEDFAPFSDEDYQYILKDDYPYLVLH